VTWTSDGYRVCLGIFSLCSGSSPYIILFWEATTVCIFSFCMVRLKLTLPSSAANQVTQQMAMSNPGAGMMGPEQDPDKLFLNEAENLEVLDHQWILEGIEERLVAKLAI
jgi:hypothetical protein